MTLQYSVHKVLRTSCRIMEPNCFWIGIHIFLMLLILSYYAWNIFPQIIPSVELFPPLNSLHVEHPSLHQGIAHCTTCLEVPYLILASNLLLFQRQISYFIWFIFLGYIIWKEVLESSQSPLTMNHGESLPSHYHSGKWT